MAAQDRFVWLDTCRLIAGVSMVGLHATADPSGQPWIQYAEGERVIPLLIRAVIYTARTELFLIISIFLLLMALDRRPKTYRDTIAIQTRRLLVPFAFWTVFYAGFNLIKAQNFGYAPQLIAQMGMPMVWVEYFVLGDVKYHMHFIPTLFGLVLIYPLFKLAVKFPQLGFAVIVCLVVKRELDGFLWSTFWGEDWLPWAIRAVKILTYAGYGMVAGACLGLWMRLSHAAREQWVPVILFSGAMLFLIKLVSTYKTISEGAWPHSYTPGYWADFLMPVVLFGLCMCFGGRKWPNVLSRIAPYSFGIYLCHPIFLDLSEIVLKNQGFSPTGQVLIKILVAVPMTTLLTFGLSRLPALAWTVGMGPLPRFRSAQLNPR